MTSNILHEIDTCGTCCPIPMISTLKVLMRLKTGDRIKVLATDHGFLKDINSISKSGKCKIIETGETDDFEFAIIEKV